MLKGFKNLLKMSLEIDLKKIKEIFSLPFSSSIRPVGHSFPAGLAGPTQPPARAPSLYPPPLPSWAGPVWLATAAAPSSFPQSLTARPHASAPSSTSECPAPAPVPSSNRRNAPLRDVRTLPRSPASLNADPSPSPHPCCLPAQVFTFAHVRRSSNRRATAPPDPPHPLRRSRRLATAIRPSPCFSMP